MTDYLAEQEQQPIPGAAPPDEEFDPSAFWQQQEPDFGKLEAEYNRKVSAGEDLGWGEGISTDEALDFARYEEETPGDQEYMETPTGYIQEMNYWEDPKAVARYYNLLRSAPPDWEPPDWLNPDDVNAAYNYFKFKNEGKEWFSWKPLDYNDPATPFLRSMQKPPDQFLKENLPHEQPGKPRKEKDRRGQGA